LEQRKKKKPHKSVNIVSTRSKQPIENNGGTGIKLTPLQQKMQRKLQGARFRWLNEQLYTTHSSDAFKMFTENPKLFEEASQVMEGGV
jgi:ribosomal RNA-processing protein 8